MILMACSLSSFSRFKYPTGCDGEKGYRVTAGGSNGSDEDPVAVKTSANAASSKRCLASSVLSCFHGAEPRGRNRGGPPILKSTPITAPGEPSPVSHIVV